MTNKKTLKATLPDGYVITRKTDKAYQFVVAALSSEPYHMARNNNQPDWVYTLWTTRLDLAEREAKRAAKIYGGEIQILPVSE